MKNQIILALSYLNQMELNFFKIEPNIYSFKKPSDSEMFKEIDIYITIF